MRTRPSRPGRRRWENRAGWWGILRAGLIATTATTAAVVLASAMAGGGPAALSALLGGGAVLALSALTAATTALVWDRAREAALPLSLGAFVLKLVVFGLLLGVAPRPDWLQARPAGVAALVAVVVWQATEVLVFARTRREIYGS